MIRVIVAGAAGRVGTRIINFINSDEEMILAGAFEHPQSPFVGRDAGQAAGIGDTGVIISPSLDEIIDSGDVVIDFTMPESTVKNLESVVSKNLAMVIGTTGITGDALAQLQDKARQIRCVMAPNMGVGMNVMFRVVAEMARILGNDFDMEIMEAHHRMKKDAPSGTAMGLAGVLAKASGRDLEKCAIYSRKGMIGERSDEEIGIQTLRAGDITGDHTVMFAGIGERLEITHRAHSRDNFAQGALRAAKWLMDRPAGLYDMQDVLGIRERAQ